MLSALFFREPTAVIDWSGASGLEVRKQKLLQVEAKKKKMSKEAITQSVDILDPQGVSVLVANRSGLSWDFTGC